MEINPPIDSQKREPSPIPANQRPSKKPRLDGDAKGLTLNKKHKLSKRQKQKVLYLEAGSADDILWKDVTEILGKDVVDDAIQREVDLDAPVAFGDEFELEVVDLSSNGESIARLPSPHPPWAIVTPFALPGELIRVKVSRNARMLSHADLLEVVRPNTGLRDMSRVSCRYFGTCAGCQYQMLDYPTQLEFKRKVVDKAYRNFFGSQLSLVPPALPTIGSPKIYGYRTKITPHFDAPPSKGKRREDWQVWIGFDTKGRRKVLDIEECPIATPVLNKALGPIRKEVQNNIDTYKRAATLLMRDSILPPDKVPDDDSIIHSQEEETHVCVRDHKATVRERVGTTLFEFPANSFFQNNNSVLVPLTEYVREAIISRDEMEIPTDQKPTHLVDTYCGSGLFAITLSPYFERVAGIEISEESIRYARHNLKLNSVPEERCTFRAGQAENIFEVVQDFPSEKTVVVIDPPRKGCDERFIQQLLAFKPETVVYVSCNVHTQARDVGGMMKTGEYKLESVRGFDLFPQTAHVESVAVLRKIKTLSTEEIVE